MCVFVLVWWLVDALIQSCFPPIASIGIFRYIPQIFPATMDTLFANLISVPHPVFTGSAISFLLRFTAFFTSFTSFHPFGVDILPFFTPFFLPFFRAFRHKTPAFLIAPPAFSTQQTEISFFTPFLHKPHISLLINNIRNLTNP